MLVDLFLSTCGPTQEEEIWIESQPMIWRRQTEPGNSPLSDGGACGWTRTQLSYLFDCLSRGASTCRGNARWILLIASTCAPVQVTVLAKADTATTEDAAIRST